MTLVEKESTTARPYHLIQLKNMKIEYHSFYTHFILQPFTGSRLLFKNTEKE